jgi:hypothetical protein
MHPWFCSFQGGSLFGLQCIQGSVALLDQGPDDGCFLCWPQSYRCHGALMEARSRAGGPGSSTARFGGSEYYVPLTKKELRALAEGAFGGPPGLEPKRVPVRRGSVILWRSDLVHSGAAPAVPTASSAGSKVPVEASGSTAGSAPAQAVAVSASVTSAGPPPPSPQGSAGTSNFRAVVYVCMAPAALTPEACYGDKLKAYQGLETSGHWPGREDFFALRDRPAREPYWPAPPPLTTRQAQLFGLVRYEGMQATRTAAGDGDGEAPNELTESVDSADCNSVRWKPH